MNIIYKYNLFILCLCSHNSIALYNKLGTKNSSISTPRARDEFEKMFASSGEYILNIKNQRQGSERLEWILIYN